MSTLSPETSSKHAATADLAIVIPCFNERDGVAELANRLRPVVDTLSEQWQVELVFVDDGSTDATGERLQEAFHGWERVRVVTHDRNRGITAAMLTGLRATGATVACTLDADCTYDPCQLLAMLPLLTPDVAVVTASPYHPDGRVWHVPAWRLRLSKLASWLYRGVFRQRLHTYTSCCRVYRVECLDSLEVRQAGFVGITELLWRLDQAGYRIVECPAELSVRRHGQSKMRVARVAWRHLLFLGQAWWSDRTSRQRQ